MKKPCITIVALALVFSAANSVAQNILIINDSDPAAVTFTATTNDSIGTETMNSFNDGLTLGAFLTNSNPGFFGDPLAPTTLTTAANMSPVYDMWGNDFADFDLYRYANDPDSNSGETVTTGSQALAGAATADLSVVRSFLPAPGTSGAVYSGSEDSPDFALIGYYEVVPEPNPEALILAGSLTLLIMWRWRLRRRLDSSKQLAAAT